MSDFNIGSLENSSTYIGNVLSAEPTDIYRFTLSAPGSFSLSLNGLSADADMKLLDSTGSVLHTSSNRGTSPEVINADALIAGDYSIEISRVSGDTDYILEVSPTTNTDPLTGQPLAPSNNSPFESGVFKVGPTGKVDLSYLFDGGFYEGEAGIFKLEGMSAFLTDYSAFAKEAARRALSNSSEGHVVISDFTEGAKLTGVLGAEPQNWNKGTYQGVKTFSMNPGDEFGIILATRKRIQDVFNNPALTGTRRPLFSLATSDPRDAFNSGQIADVTGKGYAFALEDMQVNAGADRDYNDVMFQVAGATGTAPSVNNVIVPSLDWRGTVLGQQILDEINSADTEPPEIAAYLENDTGEDTADGITSDPTIAGTVIDVSGIFSLRAGFEGMPVESFAEIASRLNQDGTFSLDRKALEEIFGGALSEGSHTLYLRAIDENGNVSGFEGIRFTLEPPATNDSDSAVSEIEFNVALAQIYGLDPYPDAVSLPVGGTRQLSVKVNELPNSPDLNTDESGTRYEVSEPSVLSVSEDGLVTALKSGDATVTVSNGSAVEVIPIRVENPQLGPATLGAPGGVVRASDGSMIMVAPGALDGDITVSLTPLSRDNLSLPVPEGFEIAGAFNLDAGDDPMKVPVQLAIPAPAGLEAGTEVFFLRKGELPDSTGTFNPIWMVEESGTVGSDGMIRTASPPWKGAYQSGEYTIAIPKFEYSVERLQFAIGTHVASVALIVAGVAIAADPKLAPLGFGLAASVAGGVLLAGVPLLYDAAERSVSVLTIPKVGLPYTTPSGVQLNPGQLATLSAEKPNPPQIPTAPVINKIEVTVPPQQGNTELVEGRVVYLSGKFGTNLEDLTVNFIYGGKEYAGTVLPHLTQLDEESGMIAVKSDFVPYREAQIAVKKRTTSIIGTQEELETEPVKIPVEPCVELALVPRAGGDGVSVINALNSRQVVEQTSSFDLLQANIPAGTSDKLDGPRYAAVTGSGSRAYVPLQQSGRVAVVDVMGLKQLDTNPDIEGMNPINLPANARPFSIVIDSSDEYAYIADSQKAAIYMLDIDPFSQNYNTCIKTIQLDGAPQGLRQMAINSDGTRLFVTTPNGSSSGKGQILVINIDPQDRPVDAAQNPRKWHQQIGKIEAGFVTEGISATPEPMKMAFTNRNQDFQGYGVLTVTNNDPLSFAATVKYASLGLGVATDYFDVNEGVAVTVMRDEETGADYAFVAGRNGRLFGSGVESIDGVRAGSNIGILKNALGDTPELVAATRPIPNGLTSGLAPSSDNRYLLATYPGIQSTFAFDVKEIIKTLNEKTAAQLSSTPIDDLNPNISIAADLRDIGNPIDSLLNKIPYGVPAGSNTGPITTGGTPFSVAMASVRNPLNLLPVDVTGDPLKPTFTWNLEGKKEGELPGQVCIDPVQDEKVEEINLYVSVFDKQNGLLPEKWKPTNGIKGVDYNPNRVLTATWKNVAWTWNGGSKPGSKYEFTLPDDRMLTAGQTYHWAVKAKVKGKSSYIFEDEQFKTPLREASNPNTFSSVTVLTRGFEPISGYKIDQQFETMAKQIVSDGGSIVSYNSETGKWNPVKGSGNPKLGKPLVLIPGWEQSPPETALNSGFAEAAADAFFASLVQLDQSLGGSVGDGSGSGLKLYNNEGDLIRTLGSLFQSPLHFIGFGQGAVINSEIVQRLGTFFPKEDYSNAFPDIQMTTVDPHDFLQESLWSQSVREPEVKVWENVTFADNYYQDVIPATEPKTFTFNGREIEGADLNVSLGNWAGFTEVDDKKGGNHRQALAWYAGTANLSGSQLPPKDGEYIYRRLGDLEPADRTPNSNKIWYTPDYRGYPFIHGSQNAPWEGIGTGWFHSVIGGGKDKRRDPLLGVRTPVSEDNTAEARMRGDFAVPTLFNGNFDAISTLRSSQSIPGWSFYNGGQDVSQQHLVEWSSIGLNSNYLKGVGYTPNQPNYALMLSGDGLKQITHSRFIVPDWGALRFSLYVPQLTGGQLKVSIKGESDASYQTIGTISLTKPIANDGTNQNFNSYLDDRFKIGFGMSGFESFHIDDSDSPALRNLRGKLATLKFELVGDGAAFLDDIFFKSVHLKFGNPTYYGQEARADLNQPENYLVEKPQYALSYNNNTKTPNWVSWQLNSSWIGTEPRRTTWNPDRTLPASFEPVTEQDYQNLSSPIVKGHMIASQHRNRTIKDIISTFITKNAIPQAYGNNDLNTAWYKLEEFSQNLAKERGMELYIAAGGYGTSNHPEIPSTISNKAIAEFYLEKHFSFRPSRLGPKGY
jgi:hypothetical protein